MKRPGRTIALCLLAPLFLGAMTACGNDSNFTQDATSTNTLTSASVFAITGGPPETQAAYQLTSNAFVRPIIGQSTGVINFDVIFDIRDDGKVLLIPARKIVPFPPVGSTPSIALLKSNQTFDALVRAPTAGYVADSVAVAAAGETWLVKLVSTQCFYGESLYAKIAIDSVIPAQRRIVVKAIANLNCGGYRGLTVGIPTN